ncbi:MAG: hypothetical protein U9N37_07320, partial [Thermodesulfobacteriota bacterium]|nr:hypothetical protein [Thermodesulfobacteriota bacterium]
KEEQRKEEVISEPVVPEAVAEEPEEEVISEPVVSEAVAEEPDSKEVKTDDKGVVQETSSVETDEKKAEEE